MAALAALVVHGFWGDPRPTRVLAVTTVNSNGQRLGGFFDGLRSDPRYDARLVALLQQPQRKCGNGLIDRALGLIETVAYAEDYGCNNPGCGQCGGSYWADGEPQTCQCSSSTYPWAVWDAGNPSTQGLTTNCAPICNGCSGSICGTQSCYNPPPPPPGCWPTDPCSSNYDCRDEGGNCQDGCCAPPPSGGGGGNNCPLGACTQPGSPQDFWECGVWGLCDNNSCCGIAE